MALPHRKTKRNERSISQFATLCSNLQFRYVFILVESAWMVIQKDPVLSLCFHNLTKRMQPNKAIIRIERKLLNRIYYVLKNERTYECGIIK